MLIKALIFVVLLLSCGSKEKKTQDNPMMLQAHLKGQEYCSQITDAVFKNRCDKITFKAIVSVNCPQDLSKLEANGRWDKDEQQCFPKESPSSLSKSDLISVLHYIWTKQDGKMLQRLMTYGESRNWVIGEGPTSLTDAVVLVPLIYYMNDKLKKTGELADDTLPTTGDITQSFSGHDLASYVWLMARINNGYLDFAAKSIIGKLYNSAPSDPMYSALQHRFLDGNQAETYFILLADPTFSTNELPEEIGVFKWSSAPASVYYLISLAIAEGL